MDEAEEYERAERIHEVKRDLAQLLQHRGIEADPYALENDLLVSGPLSGIMEFCQEARSEIEELG